MAIDELYGNIAVLFYLHVVCGWLCDATAEMNSCNRDRVAWATYYPALILSSSSEIMFYEILIIRAR